MQENITKTTVAVDRKPLLAKSIYETIKLNTASYSYNWQANHKISYIHSCMHSILASLLYIIPLKHIKTHDSESRGQEEPATTE